MGMGAFEGRMVRRRKAGSGVLLDGFTISMGILWGFCGFELPHPSASTYGTVARGAWFGGVAVLAIHGCLSSRGLVLLHRRSGRFEAAY